jgi:DNA-3-methyladenine glycosylase I
VKVRCAWAGDDPAMTVYHDREWGVPQHDDRALFELLILEGAQAGLSWSTILRKREAYRAAYREFDPAVVARFDARKQSALLRNPGIVRNTSKIAWSVRNARAFVAVQREFGSFDRYLWQFVKGRPVVNCPRAGHALPPRTVLSDRISADLRKRGFGFVGSTIVYAFLQATGVVNDHVVECFRAARKCRAARG